MATTEIVDPKTEKLESQEVSVVTEANAMEIQSHADLSMATEFLKRIKNCQSTVVETFADMKDKAHKAHKAITSKEKKFLEPLKQAESTVKAKMADYQEAEAERLKAEQKRLEEQAREAEEERRLEAAAQLESQGHEEAAEQVLSAPIQAPVVQRVAAAPKIAGLGGRTTWEYEIVDENAIPRQFMTPDLKAIAQHGRSLKEKASIAGVKFSPKKSVSVRTK